MAVVKMIHEANMEIPALVWGESPMPLGYNVTEAPDEQSTIAADLRR